MRRALVTGATGGLGRAIALRLAADGWRLALGCLDDDDRAEQAAADVRALGVWATPLASTDLADEQAVRLMVEAAVEQLGGLDLVVSAAGPFIPLVWIGELAPGRFASVLDQDLKGFYHLLHHVLPYLRRSSGSLVALTTPAVIRHAKRDVMSSAPKAAIEAIVRGVAAEEGRFGVRANCVAPGLIAAGLYDGLVENGDFDAAYFAAMKRNVPLRRTGAAADVAEAVAFLASPESAGYITGQTLRVDGGYSA